MTDLPDRDRELKGSEVPSISRRVYFAWKRGDLKSRDEMNEEALLAAVQRGESPGKIADAAWGVDDDA